MKRVVLDGRPVRASPVGLVSSIVPGTRRKGQKKKVPKHSSQSDEVVFSLLSTQTFSQRNSMRRSTYVCKLNGGAFLYYVP